MSEPIAPQTTSTEADNQQPHQLIAELMEDAEAKRQMLMKIDAMQDITQAHRNARRSRIDYWAKQLEISPRTLDRWHSRFRKEGWSAIVPAVRADKGKVRGGKNWKPSTDYWVKFIQRTYKDGNRHSRRMNCSQVYNQVKAHARLELSLSDGEYPSHFFVYQVLEPLAKKPKIRHPGQGPGILIKTTAETLSVEYSNQVWQIDHTPLDILLTNEGYEILGRPYLTTIIDSYSGCVLGFYLGFAAAGSHEVGLALRHAVLQKQYGSEYELTNDWEPYGLPDYIVTDRAKEFKSKHLKHVAADLGIKLRYRAYPEQGGIIESSFDKNNKELLSLLPGYTGSNVQKRPQNAEKYACLTYKDLELVFTRYLVDHYNHHHPPGVYNQTRNQRWWAGLVGGQPRTIDEHRLDLCLMKTLPRKVQKLGSVLFKGLTYQADWLKDYESQWVVLRYDPRNIVALLVYSAEIEGKPARFLGMIKPRGNERDVLILRDVEDNKKQMRLEGQKIDQASILSERIALNRFAKKEIKTLKQRRRAEQDRINKKAPPINVVELRPTSSSTPESTPLDVPIAATDHHKHKSPPKPADERKSERASEIISFDWNQLMDDA